MVAQIDEQHAAMVADAVAPAADADGFAVVGVAELAAGVRAIDVHLEVPEGVRRQANAAMRLRVRSGKSPLGKEAHWNLPKRILYNTD
jgi:hypothetical protein